MFAACTGCPWGGVLVERKACGDDGIVQGTINISDDVVWMGESRLGPINESGLNKCHRIEGSVWISNRVTDLSALNQIDAITEDVVIIDANAADSPDAFACFLPALTQVANFRILFATHGLEIQKVGCVDHVTTLGAFELGGGVASLIAFNGVRTVQTIMIRSAGDTLQAFQALETADAIEMHLSDLGPLVFPALRSVRHVRLDGVLASNIAFPVLEAAESLEFHGQSYATFIDVGAISCVGVLDVFGGYMLAEVRARALREATGNVRIMATQVAQFDTLPVLSRVGGDLTVQDNERLLADRLDEFTSRVTVTGTLITCGNGPQRNVPTSCP